MQRNGISDPQLINFLEEIKKLALAKRRKGDLSKKLKTVVGENYVGFLLLYLSSISLILIIIYGAESMKLRRRILSNY